MRDLFLTAVLVPLLVMAAAQPFVGVLVWSWISFMNPHREVWGFAQTLPWAMLSFLVIIFGCVIAREPKRPAVNGVTVMMLLFGVGITITSLVALAPPELVWPKWNRTIKVLLGLLLTAALLTDRRRIHAMVWLIVISLGFYGVKGGIFTVMTGGAFIVLGPDGSMITDRNHLAVALLVAIPLMNYLRLQSPHPVVRICLIAAMVCTLFAVVGSQSRGALIGLAATAGFLWLRSPGKIISGIGIVAALAAVILFMPESWVERMNTISNYEEDGSAMGRITIWIAIVKLALMRPLFGTGFVGFYQQYVVNMVAPDTEARASHSIWLEVLGEHGFVVLAVWLGILAYGVLYTLRITRLAKGRPDLRWALDLARMSQVSIIAYCSGGSFLSLSYWDAFWTVLVIIAATYTLVVKAVTVPAAEPAAREGWRPPGLRLGRPATAARRALPS